MTLYVLLTLEDDLDFINDAWVPCIMPEYTLYPTLAEAKVAEAKIVVDTRCHASMIRTVELTDTLLEDLDYEEMADYPESWYDKVTDEVDQEQLEAYKLLVTPKQICDYQNEHAGDGGNFDDWLWDLSKTTFGG